MIGTSRFHARVSRVEIIAISSLRVCTMGGDEGGTTG